MRCFIGLPFDPHTIDYFSRLQQTLCPLVQKGHFSRPDQFHLTLAFLGEIPEVSVDRYITVLKEAAQSFSSFPLRLNGIGHFEKKSQHILWAAVEENKKLTILQHCLEEALSRQTHYQPEHSVYTPHITLARKVLLNVPFEDAEKELSAFSQSTAINQLVLYESKQIQHKLHYLPLASFDLRKE